MASDSVLYITVVGSDRDPAASVAARVICKSDSPREGINKLINYLQGLAGGNYDGKVFVALAGANTGTAGTGTIIATQANATAGDTVTIGATTLTVRASPSTDPKLGEFAAGASDTACGDNLAAAINAHPDFKGFLTAVNVTGTVTITLTDKGLHANLLNFSTSDATAFAVTSPTNGAEGTLHSQLRCYRRGF
jgi:hypothetical protein